MTTAIVTGATGMTGGAVVSALLADKSYDQIYTLSRSQPSSLNDPRIKHAHLDLQSSAEDMANDLKHISGQEIIIFCCAYLARDSETEAAKVNCQMLQSFITALRTTGVLQSVKRIILTCGLKQYGVHLGETKQPMHESDTSAYLTPHDPKYNWPENFYYSQQQVLIDNAHPASANGHGDSYTWTITLPQDVIGMAKANFMNEATALGLYSSVAKFAHPNSELPFPGSRANFLSFNSWTSAELHAKFCLWAARESKAAGQIFNVVNGDVESWQNLWPKVAERFGCTLPEELFPGGGEESKYRDFAASGPQDLHPQPPIALQASSSNPAQGGFAIPELGAKPSRVYQQIDTVAWSKRSEVKEAWKMLKEKYGLEQEAWDRATWGFLTFVLGREFSCVVSMSKARKMGWTGYEDTWESFERTFQQLEAAGVLPPADKLRNEKVRQ